MHATLFIESFSFCLRDDLERLQPVSQSLLYMIFSGSNVLPLRSIDRVHMDFDQDDAEDKPDYEASLLGGDFTEIFGRLQHTCIKEFRIGIRDSHFLRYWKAQGNAVFTLVSIRFSYPKTMDYDLLDSIVNHLRPRTRQVHIDWWHENDYMMKCLARNSLVNSLRTCCLLMWTDDFPPPPFIINEAGYPNNELRFFGGQVADGIDGFFEILSLAPR